MIDWSQFGEIALRLGAAALAGILIGLNRDVAGKPMGARTLALVALGAAIVTVAAVTDPIVSMPADARSRVLQGVLQGVLAGIGFIGAGVIVRGGGKEVHNLTTAATVWTAAALGIACGLGEWMLAGIGAALVLIVLAAEGVENAIVKMLGGKKDEKE